MANNIGRIARYGISALLGAAALFAVESGGFSKVYQDIEVRKAEIYREYGDYLGYLKHNVSSYVVRGGIDLAAFGLPFLVTGKINQKLRKRKGVESI